MGKCNCNLSSIPPKHNYECLDQYCLCNSNTKKHYHPYGFVFKGIKNSRDLPNWIADKDTCSHCGNIEGEHYKYCDLKPAS